MFEKLFLLVKNSAGNAVINNPEVPEKYKEAVITEASSSIIDVLKNHIESGKLKDLVSFFQLNSIRSNTVVSSIVNKYTNRLNKYYGIAPLAAFKIADELIPAVMIQLVQHSKADAHKDLSAMVSHLNGNRADLSTLVNSMLIAS